MHRHEQLLAMRPEISTLKITDDATNAEQFQNTTLRPILKLQNSILLAVFKSQIRKHKNKFYELSLEKILTYIDTTLKNDNTLKNKLLGVTIAMFTINEYEFYDKNSSAINKRIMQLLAERFKSQLQIL